MQAEVELFYRVNRMECGLSRLWVWVKPHGMRFILGKPGMNSMRLNTC